ncbi:MAG: insulinase family protein [Myxococcota bacterium]|nr:insulinase family protein [Myxococcota bacterium]
MLLPVRAAGRPLTLLLPLCLVLTGAASPGPTVPQLAFSRLQLANGLEVLIHEDHSVPLVAVSIWYHVGSKDEERGRTGFAHLFEHMMFQGSRHVGDDMHFKYVQQAGGTLNGTTNTDRTNYFAVVPAGALERVLFLEADRMGFLLDALTQEKLDNQREVVRNERRQNYEVAPYGLAPRYLAEALYPEGHPYRHLTIGEHKDLEAATLDDVRTFFNRYYTPSNAVLVIAGDVDPKEARRLVDKWFGPLPRRERPPLVRQWAMPVLTQERRVEATDRVSLPRLYVVWHSPARFHPGDAELDLLARVLGGKEGRLYRRLVYQDRLAQEVEVFQQSQLLSSRFGIVATAREGKRPEELLQAIDDELHQLRRSPPSQQEMERARNQIEAALLFDLDELGGFRGRAEMLQQYFYYAGDPDYLARDLERYRRATPQTVHQALLTYLGPGRVVLTISPGPATGPRQEERKG